jgi:hypothetical protein
VAGEGRNLLEPSPASEAKSAYQDQGRPAPWTSKSMLVFSVKVNGIR